MLSIALVSVLLSQAILPVSTAKADGPKFNFLADDSELIRGANKSVHEVDWHKPVDGQAGDTFAGIVYYHNGVPGTVAHDTNVRLNLPQATTNGKLVIGATISASNAAAASGTMDVNLDQDASVTLIPGSVQWFPNYRSVSTPAHALLDGQTGQELIGSGFGIGDINGCWDYVGYVVFQFKTEKLPEAKIVQSKIAKNLVTGQEGTDIAANPGDEVLYTLSTKNVGNKSADYVIEDDLSDILELADILEVSSGGTVSNGKVSYPAVHIAAGENVIRTFKVKVKNPQPVNVQSGKHFDGIMENVYGNCVFVRIGKIIPGRPCLKIEKSVRNVTINETGFVKENQAKAGDILEYKIVFSNSGDKAENLTLIDELPANVSYVKGSTVLVKGGKNYNPGDILTTDGISIASLEKGESITVRFRVKIDAGIANGEVLVNTASLWFSKEKISDTAKTKIVAKPIPTTPSLPMTGAETPILSLLFSTTGALYLKFRKAKNALFLLKR